MTNLIQNNKQICVICVANYCRSPVAERLLSAKFQDKFNIISAGLSPMISADMDPRSKNFLKKFDVPYDKHLPRRVTEKIMQDSSLIFGIDLLVLQELNRLFPRFKNKIKLLNYQLPKISLFDPFKYDDAEYIEVMKRIKRVIDHIDIEI